MTRSVASTVSGLLGVNNSDGPERNSNPPCDHNRDSAVHRFCRSPARAFPCCRRNVFYRYRMDGTLVLAGDPHFVVIACDIPSRTRRPAQRQQLSRGNAVLGCGALNMRVVVRRCLHNCVSHRQEGVNNTRMRRWEVVCIHSSRSTRCPRESHRKQDYHIRRI